MAGCCLSRRGSRCRGRVHHTARVATFSAAVTSRAHLASSCCRVQLLFYTGGIGCGWRARAKLRSHVVTSFVRLRPRLSSVSKRGCERQTAEESKAGQKALSAYQWVVAGSGVIASSGIRRQLRTIVDAGGVGFKSTGAWAAKTKGDEEEEDDAPAPKPTSKPPPPPKVKDVHDIFSDTRIRVLGCCCIVRHDGSRARHTQRVSRAGPSKTPGSIRHV